MQGSSSIRRRGRPSKPDTDEKAAKSLVVALDRGLRVLIHLAESRGSTLTEVAQAINAPIATVHRILSTLQQRGMAEYSEAAQKWFVGAQAFSVGNAYVDRSNIVDVARPILQRLAEDTGETANLAIEADGELVYLLQVESQNPIRASFKSGVTGDIHCSGIGKAILAHFDSPRLEKILGNQGMPRLTPKTICDPGEFASELEGVRKQGWAIDDEERSIGMRCVAAAVQNAIGDAIGGISVSGPAHRFTDERVREFAGTVAAAAASITTTLSRGQ